MSTQNGSENGLNGELKDSLVLGRTNQGVEIRANLIRLTRYLAVFEIYDPSITLFFSEALNDFKIVLRDRVVYLGRAVVRGLVNAGLTIVCEATLNEDCWRDVEFVSGKAGQDKLCGDFREFIQNWQKLYRVSPDYKIAVADIQSFLTDLRLWLDQVELGIRSSPAEDRIKLECEMAYGLRDSVISALNHLFDRFEAASEKIEHELRPAHRAYGSRQLHPLLLCSPFIYRCYTKPLGYAGDYEMMNMIVRNGYEGSSLFAKLANAYLLDQAPPHAVRNRVVFLNAKIIEETSRVARLGKTASIYCLACGPAREAENFVAEHPLANQAQFHLLDFNEETLRYAVGRLEAAKRNHQRKTKITAVKNSVHNLLKSGGKPVMGQPKYDLIYCSGLYDYLSDRVCKKLNTYLYDQLRPGGLLVVGNFAPSTPRQNLMEHLMEWFLIYRDSKQLAALAPEQASEDNCRIRAETTGSNIFLEARKPE